MEHFGLFSLSEGLDVVGQDRLVVRWPVLFLPILIGGKFLTVLPLVTTGRRGDSLEIITFLAQGGDTLLIVPLLIITILIVRRKEVNRSNLVESIGAEGTALKITQSVLEVGVAWMLQWRVQLDNSSVQPMSTIPVDKFPVYHSSLPIGSSVQMNHWYTLLICTNHPRLYNLTSY